MNDELIYENDKSKCIKIFNLQHKLLSSSSSSNISSKISSSSSSKLTTMNNYNLNVMNNLNDKFKKHDYTNPEYRLSYKLWRQKNSLLLLSDLNT